MHSTEHRRMLATILNHSCYCIANRSYVNKPELIGGRDEISSRFYEGWRGGYGDDRRGPRAPRNSDRNSIGRMR
jgi:hypothetical protein